MNYKTFFIILVSSVTMLIVIGFLTPSINYNSLVGFIAYFCFTIYCIKKLAKKQSDFSVFIIILAVRIIIDLWGIYLYFTQSISSLPWLIIHILAITSGFLYFRLKSPLKLVPFLLASFFTVFMFFQGWQYWIHRAQYGTFTGKVSYSLPAKFEVFDENKNLITEQNFNGKIVLLDFWTTSCAVCFAKFPQLEQLHQTYKNDSSVMLLAVNEPIEEDTPNQAFEIIREEGYSFPVVKPKDADMAEKFGVYLFPVVFVINETGTIVYKGNIEGAVKKVEELKQNNL